MNFLRKFIFPLLLVLWLSGITGINSTYGLDPVTTGQITGTWLYLWWHGDASIINTDGAPITKPVFMPESYRETDDQKSESFIRFRADGTGTYFKRYIVFKNNGDKIAVVTKDRSGQWVKGDRPAAVTHFRWATNGDRVKIQSRGQVLEFNQNIRYRFIINTTPTRRASRSISNRLQLSDELIIYQLGQFLKVGRTVEQDFSERYHIE
jgi:hypothetical protein